MRFQSLLDYFLYIVKFKKENKILLQDFYLAYVHGCVNAWIIIFWRGRNNRAPALQMFSTRLVNWCQTGFGKNYYVCVLKKQE